MSEKKYTGFAALAELDRLPDQRSARSAEPAQPVNQSASVVNHGQPEVDNQLTSLDNQLTSESSVNQPLTVVNQNGSPVNQSAADEALYPSRKERKLVGLRLPKDKVEQYRMWCLLNKMDLQDAVEQAMDWLTNQIVVNQFEPVNQSGSPPHDHDDHDDDSTIIDLFEQIIETKYKAERDRNSLAQIRKYSPEVIEAGFIMARLRAKEKIHSVKYCVGAIEEVQKAGINKGRNYLKYLRAKLAEAKNGSA